MFEKQVEFFRNRYNVIVWDAPAHGNSRPYMNFSYEDTSTILLQILKNLQIDSVVLVGQSMGG